MSNRRYSIVKLSARLRILESDLTKFLEKHGIKSSPNTHMYFGYDPDKIRIFLDGLDTFSKNEMYLLKTKWEQEKARQKPPTEEYFSLGEVAVFFNIPKNKARQFLNKNNVPKVDKNSYTFWDSVAVLNILNKPSKKQFTDLNKIKAAKVSESNLDDLKLSEILEVPVEFVARWKRVLKIENIYPLTDDYALNIVSSSGYESKLQRFLSREKKKEADKSQKDIETRSKVALHKTAASVTHTDNEIIDGIPADKKFSATQAAILLGVSAQSFRKSLKIHGIESNSFYTNRYKQKIDLFTYKVIQDLKDNEDIVKARHRSSKAQERIKNKQQALRVEQDAIRSSVAKSVVVNIRDRKEAPYSTMLYIGPTNSGKTYNALNALYAEYEENKDGIYVYAGPLRMLAYEVYLKMVNRYGESDVGFITGEEQINPDAHLLATTAEMAPSEGNSLVLDESHWLIEPSRGHNWTNLLIGGKYKNLHILTAVEARENILELVEDSYNIEEIHFTRKTPIKYGGVIKPRDIMKKTAVICFSRKMVYKVARLISENTDLTVGVLYGALPLLARENQINEFIEGKVDVIVTTDVIGHGINLPLDNVVYAETEKFDGQSRRSLRLWEAAQISGRAGRYGLSKEGRVSGLELGWNRVDYTLIQRSTLAAAGKINTELKVVNALIAPRFADLGITKSEHLMIALETWKQKAEKSLEGRSITPAPLQDMIALLETVASTLSTPIYPWDKNKDERKYPEGVNSLYPEKRALNDWNIKPEVLWQLISGPFDTRLPTISVVAEWLQINKKENLIEWFYKNEMIETLNAYGDNLEVLEKLARVVSELKMVDIAFPLETGLDYDNLHLLEKEISKRIIEKINEEMDYDDYGSCAECGNNCDPRYSYCYECYIPNKRRQFSYV